jgi:NAD(P)-dependent dehydrogenase (short-subunit alcohol dehydrogenase family)
VNTGTGALTGKVAIVTGAARGIGEGIARRFAAEGAAVAVLDRDAAGAQHVAEAIGRAGGRSLAVACDVADAASVNAAAALVASAFGPVSVLVNNAAVMPGGAVHTTDPDAIDRCLAVNIKGAFLMSAAVLPGMLQAGRGSIVHMASVTALLGLPGIALYSATKGALVSLARAMSTDYAGRGVRTNAVAPGTIDSPMLHDFLAAQRPENRARLRAEFDAMHPIGRVGTIDEVAQVCVFLASDLSSFVTGAVYSVDGGLSVRGEQPQDSDEASLTAG